MYRYFCLQVLCGGSVNIYATEVLFGFIFELLGGPVKKDTHTHLFQGNGTEERVFEKGKVCKKEFKN